MAITGERFVLDLSDDEDNEAVNLPRAKPLNDLIGEIKERTPKAATAPTTKTATGFPAPKDRRTGSAFKQRRAAAATQNAPPKTSAHDRPTVVTQRNSTTVTNPLEEEKMIIDEENKQRLAAMSDAEIENERAELLSNLSPSLLERLLRRANINDEPSDADGHDPATKSRKEPSNPESNHQKPAKSVSFAIRESEPKPSQSENTPQVQSSVPDNNEETTGLTEASGFDDREPAFPPPDLRPASEFPTGSIHFPTAPPRQGPMPDLDPTSPSFYADLQAHYFPDIAHDPSALSWLKPRENDPNDPNDPATMSPYEPSSSAATIVPSALRFSFRGEILPPSESLSLPTTLGLHHHADDPEAAGYTIPELSILSRSTVPAQRCIAWQLLGRILYRLGKGELGEPGSDLVEGLWSVVEREGVVPRMLEEAEGGAIGEKKDKGSTGGVGSNIGKHASAKAWAVEGIWLWQMGGGSRGFPREGDAVTRRP